MSNDEERDGENNDENSDDDDDDFEFEDIKAHETALEEDGGGMFDTREEDNNNNNNNEDNDDDDGVERDNNNNNNNNNNDDDDNNNAPARETIMNFDAQYQQMVRGVNKSLNVHSLGNYTFGVKVKPESAQAHGSMLIGKENTMQARLMRIKEQYEKSGGIARRSVQGVCVVNQHGCPHILLLQEAKADAAVIGGNGRPHQQQMLGQQSVFSLPGGRLRAGEGTTEGLRRKLANKLAAPNESNEDNLKASFDVLDVLSTWYRVGYEPQMYPYLPPHVTKPKETLEIFLVELPEKCYFAVPKTSKLVAVPIFELYDNAEKFGAIAASLPHLLSRISINLERDNEIMMNGS